MGFSLFFLFSKSYRPIDGTFEKNEEGKSLFTVSQKEVDKKISLVVHSRGGLLSFIRWLFSNDLVRLRVQDKNNSHRVRVLYVTAESVRKELGMSGHETQGLGRAIASLLHGRGLLQKPLDDRFLSKRVLIREVPDSPGAFLIHREDLERFQEMGLKMPEKWVGTVVSDSKKNDFWRDFILSNRNASLTHPENITPEEVDFLKEFRMGRERTDWYSERRPSFSELAETPGRFQEAMAACRDRFYRLQAQNTAFRPLMGRVFFVPNEYSFHMPGVALVASYRAEKKHLKGLYVCERVQAFQDKMKEIAESSDDGRYAFILPVLPSGIQQHYHELGRDAPQHKVAVFVEKKEGELKVAVMDPQPDPTPFINPEHLQTMSNDPWEGYDRSGAFSSHELIMRALRNASETCPTHVFFSTARRESRFGCAVFALCDAETFLQDNDFFSRITASEHEREVYRRGRGRMGYRSIDFIPPEYMVGAQSLTLLSEYERRTPGISDRTFVSKNKTLRDYGKKYHRFCGEMELNQYIMWKVYLYSILVNKALSELSTEQVQKRVSSHLLS